MSNAQITKWHGNVITDKLNLNPPLIREELVTLIFRQLDVVRSFPPPDDCEPSENQCSSRPPGKHKLVFMR